MPQMEPPTELLMPLLPYQKEFLAWAIKQEQSDVRGGCGPSPCLLKEDQAAASRVTIHFHQLISPFESSL